MKCILVIVCIGACTSGHARDNVNWGRFLSALSDVESSGGRNLWNRKEGAVGVYQMRALARKDANDYLGTSYRKEALMDRTVANQMFMAYVHRWRDRWETREDLVHLWHLGPNWKDRLALDRGYLNRFNAAWARRQ